MEGLIRVWNPVEKEMIYNLHSNEAESNVRVIIESGKVKAYFLNEQGDWVETKPLFYSGCLGREGKRGKCIYQGDKLKIDDKFLRDREFVVIFEEGCFGFRDGLRGFVLLSMVESTLITVVGHIYEDQE